MTNDEVLSDMEQGGTYFYSDDFPGILFFANECNEDGSLIMYADDSNCPGAYSFPHFETAKVKGLGGYYGPTMGLL